MRLPVISNCDRVEFICRYATSKRVLHVGCTDTPFTEQKVKRGTLLHQRIAKVAGELTGVDLSEKGIKMMRDAGILKLHAIDAELTLYSHLKEKYDVIIAGEVIEHVLNPGQFIKSLKSVCHDKSVVLITIPNFAPIKRLPRLLWRNEEVHPDHLYYFSYSTLSCLLNQCDLHPVEWCVYWRDVGKFSILVNRVLRKLTFAQYFADGFCVACKV